MWEREVHGGEGGRGAVRYLVTELSAKIAVYVVHTACNFVRGKVVKISCSWFLITKTQKRKLLRFRVCKHKHNHAQANTDTHACRHMHTHTHWHTHLHSTCQHIATTDFLDLNEAVCLTACAQVVCVSMCECVGKSVWVCGYMPSCVCACVYVWHQISIFVC